MTMHVAIPVTSRPTPGPSVPGEEDLVRATHLRPSHLSPVPRTDVLPPHHPARGCPDRTGYPYPLWSGALLPEPAQGGAGLVRLRGSRLEALVDLGHGGRLLELSTPGGQGWAAVPRPVVDGRDVRGAGLRGGIECNPSPLRRSPLALEPVHATTALPDRVGGDRLRWWELERSSGYLCQVDLHLPDHEPVLLIAVRQLPLTTGADATDARFTLLMDGGRWAPIDQPGAVGIATGTGLLTLLGDVARHEGPDGIGAEPAGTVTGDGHLVRWAALALGPVDVGRVRDLAPRALAGLDDPVPAGPGAALGAGSDWAGLELVRAASRDDAAPAVPAATPIRLPAEPDDVAARLRGAPEQQWLHLFHDQGLGTADRVHPRDVGHPAGAHWHPELSRAHRRESLGDWRVHLRLGDIAHLAGDLAEARARWAWSHALRPTAWAERNLALNDLAAGRPQDAAVRYLRAHRIDPHEVELGVEAVGCLLLAGRAQDCETVLDRMAVRAQNASARYWLLQAEVALQCQDTARVHVALDAAGRCPDAAAFEPWRTAIENAAP